MRIAIQGELGSFSHAAALSMVPLGTPLPCVTAGEVLRQLSSGESDAAVIPVENSLVGSVVDFYDLFFEHSFVIERELQMRIHHNLIGKQGAAFEGIEQVFSHPIALGQCKRLFSANPQMKATAFYDTAGGVRHVVNSDHPEWAAIAGKQAALQYGAVVLRENIEDRHENYTRFWLIRRHGCAAPEPAPAKMSVGFLLENRPGALLRALAAFAGRQLNLTRIESRPVVERPWEYAFYADVTIPGHAEADAAMQELNETCTELKELGRYRTDESHPNE